MKKQPTEWENIFTSDTTDKGLIYKTYKEFTQLNTKKLNKLIKERANGLPAKMDAYIETLHFLAQPKG